MRFTCLQCGLESDNGKNRPQRFCSPPPGGNMSACARAYNRVHGKRRCPDKRREEQRRYNARVAADPSRLEVRRAYDREYYRRDPDRARQWRVAYEERHRDRVLARNRAYNLTRPRVASTPLAGSVLAASSSRSPGRDVLLTLLSLVPRGLDESHREEVVATAALLHLEGAQLEDAVIVAARQVSRESSRLRHSRPLHECYWL